MIGAIRTLAAVLFAAILLYGLQKSTPGYGEITSPIASHGKAGKRADSHDFAAGVVEMHLARTVTIESYGTTRNFTTSGVWVLVEAAAEAKFESLTLTSAQWLGEDGISYALSDRFSSIPGMLSSQTLEPGLPRPVLMAFEIPESQISGGTLLMSRSALMPLEQELRIDMADAVPKPLRIRPEIRIGRGPQGGVPWTLEAR